jgi:signal transduction histidine kinase
MVDALETAVEEARASDAATRRFLADASHELRTPIAALQASGETLLREQPERPERDRLEAAVARDTERMTMRSGTPAGISPGWRRTIRSCAGRAKGSFSPGP